MLTNTGEIVEHQITMYRERIRSVGISLLGGNSGIEGPYELGIDSIRAVNEEDAVISGEPGLSRYLPQRNQLTAQQKRTRQRVPGGKEVPSDPNTPSPPSATTHGTPRYH